MIQTTKNKIKDVLEKTAKFLGNSNNPKDRELVEGIKADIPQLYLETWSVLAVECDFPKILERLKQEPAENADVAMILSGINDVNNIIANGGIDETSEDDEESLISKHVKTMVKEVNAWLESNNASFHIKHECHYSPYEYNRKGGIDTVHIQLSPYWNNDTFLTNCKLKNISKQCWDQIDNICAKYNVSILTYDGAWYECWLQELNGKTYHVCQNKRP